MGLYPEAAVYSFTFRQVQVFLGICDAGSFSAAAERLQVSQPAISNVVRTLETQLGVDLFVRRRGAAGVLTRDGERLRDSARRFVADCDAIAHGGRSRRARTRALRVFVGGHLLEDFVRPLLPEFMAQYPQIALHFLPERSRDQLLEDIAAGKVDVAVLTVPQGEPTPATLHLCEVPAGVYCSRALRGPFTPARVSALPFILPPAGTRLGVSMLHEMERHGVVPANVVRHVQYHDVRIRLAAQGKGAVFSVQSVVDRHDTGHVLRRVLATGPWERRAWFDPRLEPQVATALAGFVTRALGGPAMAPA